MEEFSFEWDARKAQNNVVAHGVTFEEAVSVFYDPLLLTFFDADHSHDEDRFQSIGQSERHRLLLIVHTDRGDTIRIISCRGATATERKTYEQRD